MMDLKINPKFKNALPHLSDKQKQQLEENIVADGRVRDPLVVWEGWLVDGHNRYAIASRLDIPYEITILDKKTEEEVIDWIYTNALGQRNMTPKETRYIRGLAYRHAVTKKKKVKRQNVTTDNGEDHDDDVRQNVTSLARASGVTRRTLIRDAKLADAIDKLSPQIKDRILSGQLKASANEIAALSSRSHQEQETLVEESSVKDVIPEKSGWERYAEIHAKCHRALCQVAKDIEAICDEEGGSYLSHAVTRIVKNVNDASVSVYQLTPVGEEGGQIVTRMDQQRTQK